MEIRIVITPEQYIKGWVEANGGYIPKTEIQAFELGWEQAIISVIAWLQNHGESDPDFWKQWVAGEIAREYQ